MSTVKKVLGIAGATGLAAGAFLTFKYYKGKGKREKIVKALDKVKKLKLRRKK